LRCGLLTTFSGSIRHAQVEWYLHGGLVTAERAGRFPLRIKVFACEVYRPVPIHSKVLKLASESKSFLPMVLAFAFSFIAVLLVLGNYKLIRKVVPLVLFMLAGGGLFYLGVHLMKTSRPEEPYLLMPLLSPLIALTGLEIFRLIFLGLRKQEIIMYMGGFVPKKHEERFVTSADKTLTLIIAAMALAGAYFFVTALK